MDKVSTSVIAIIGIEALIVIALPVALLIIWRHKTGARMMPALVGAFTFFLFAFVLESLVLDLVLNKLGEASLAINGSPLLYIPFVCLMAGLFEETGRLVCGRYLMKNYSDRESAVTMGIGHGGLGMIILVGISMLSYLVISLLINRSDLSVMTADMPEDQVNQLYQSLASINANTLGSALPEILEQFITMAMNISLSVLVFAAAKKQAPISRYFMAIGLHALCKAPACLYQKQLLTSEWLTVGLILLCALPAVYLGYRQYQKLDNGVTIGRGKDLRDLRSL